MRKVIGFGAVTALMGMVAAIVVVGATPAYAAGTRSFTATIPAQRVDWSGELRLPRFDPALGELDRVELHVEVVSDAELAVENLGGEPVALDTTLGGAVHVYAPAVLDAVGLDAELAAEQTRPVALGAHDGTVDHAGPSGVTVTGATSTQAYDGVAIDSTRFAPFVGDGDVVLPTTARSSTFVAGASGDELSLHSSAIVSVTATIAYHYLEPRISMTKTPVRRAIAPGEDAGFTIRVTNSGETPLGNVFVDDPAASDCSRYIGELPVGEANEFTCTMPVPTGPTAPLAAPGPAAPPVPSGTDGTDGTGGTGATGSAGEREATTPVVTNTATVSGQGGGRVVTDTDTAEVLVGTTAVALAVTPSMQTVERGSDASFTLTVTNPATLPLTDVVVTSPAAPGCERALAALAPAAVATISCALGGVDADVAVGFEVAAASDAGSVHARAVADVTVSEPAGAARTARIDIESAVDGADADTSPGAAVVAGAAARFTYVVTNTGDDTLTTIVVDDDVLGAIGCPATTLPAGAAMTCTATDAADRGFPSVGHRASASATAATSGSAVADTDHTYRYGTRAVLCPAGPAVLEGLRVRVGSGGWQRALDQVVARPGDVVTVAWDRFGSASLGCGVSLAQHSTTQQSFDPGIEQPLVASASCAGEGCRQTDGYGLSLVVRQGGAFNQLDLVTGNPLPSVGPIGGFYAGWLTGGINRLIQAGTSRGS